MKLMQTTQKLTPEQRAKWAPTIENLIEGLFRRSKQPFFDSRPLSLSLLDEFIASDEAFEEAYKFVTAVGRIWKHKHGSELKLLRVPTLSTRSSCAELEAAEDFPNLLQTTDTMYTPPSVAATTSINDDSKQDLAQAQRDSQPPVGASLNPAARAGYTPAARADLGRPAERRPTFRVPNAKVGEDYVGKISGADAVGTSLRVKNVRPPDGLGLDCQEGSGELRGRPLVAGEYRIPLQWSSDDRTWSSDECLLIVNPEPRSLWQKKDPSPDDPYFKSNVDGAVLEFSGHCIVAASRRGRSHEHSGTCRDDDFFVDHNPTSGWSVLVVADGAGSAKSSRWGSKLATEAFGGLLRTELSSDFGAGVTSALSMWSSDSDATQARLGTDFHYLFHRAAKVAVEAIEAEAQAKGAAAKDYSTTLLAAVARYDQGGVFVATFWKGDGAIAAYGPRGQVRLMGMPEGGEFAGETLFLNKAFLFGQDFAKRVRIGRFEDVAALILMTDGVSDPKFETDSGLADAARWDAFWDEIRPLIDGSAGDAAKERVLTDWLEFFSPGHHDDRTVAVLF